MPGNLKKRIAPEQSMKAISLPFFLAPITGPPWFIRLTLLLRSLFPVFSIRKAESKFVKAVHSVF